MNGVRLRILGPWLALAACVAGAFSLACLLPKPSADGLDAEGMAGKVIGGGRSAVSAAMYEMADNYFHKGSRKVAKSAITNDCFQKWSREISPQKHRHAEGVDSVEILPWLRMATQADPHNVEAFLVMSFWLASGVKRADLAEQVLIDAQRMNPRDYRIPQEQGRLAVRGGRFSEARRKLEVALIRWPSGLAEDKQILLDKAEINTFLGFLYEEAGNRKEAVGYFKNALAIFPERAYIKERVTLLQGGRLPDETARQSLERLVQRMSEVHCTAESDGHDDHEGEK